MSGSAARHNAEGFDDIVDDENDEDDEVDDDDDVDDDENDTVATAVRCKLCLSK
jgi:hypothetical protein